MPVPASLAEKVSALLAEHSVSAIVEALAAAVLPSAADIAGALSSAQATVVRMEARRARG